MARIESCFRVGRGGSLIYRNNINRFWLIDPLDGTKEFLDGSDEFMVNIALIDNSKAILGFVYTPAVDLLFWVVQDCVLIEFPKVLKRLSC